MAIKPGKFIWYEHVSNDTARAQAFYGALFGWSAQQLQMGGQPYPMLHNAGVPIGGLRADASGIPSHWACWVSAADVDATLGAAERAGARTLMPPTDFAGFGRGAVLLDPQGAALASGAPRRAATRRTTTMRRSSASGAGPS